MDHNPEIKLSETVSQPFAAVRRHAMQAELPIVLPAAAEVVWEYIRANNLPDLGLNVAVYLSGGCATGFELEVGVVMPAPFEGEGEVFCSALPAGKVVTAAHIGPYDKMGETHGAIHWWMAMNGIKPTGVSWELYGHWDDDPTKLRTDIFYLVD